MKVKYWLLKRVDDISHEIERMIGSGELKEVITLTMTAIEHNRSETQSAILIYR